MSGEAKESKLSKKIKIRRASAWDVVEITSMLLQGAIEQAEDIWYPKPAKRATRLVASVLTLIDHGLVVVAEQEVDGRIVAAIGMKICQDDWSDDWQLVNQWLYVMPDFRSTDIADQLLVAVESFADENVNPETGRGLPVIMAMVTGRDTELKDELIKRRGRYQYAGGNFVRPPVGGSDVHIEEAEQNSGDPELVRTG